MDSSIAVSIPARTSASASASIRILPTDTPLCQ
jgi:hypothetical protein